MALFQTRWSKSLRSQGAAVDPAGSRTELTKLGLENLTHTHGHSCRGGHFGYAVPLQICAKAMYVHSPFMNQMVPKQLHKAAPWPHLNPGALRFSHRASEQATGVECREGMLHNDMSDNSPLDALASCTQGQTPTQLLLKGPVANRPQGPFRNPACPLPRHPRHHLGTRRARKKIPVRWASWQAGRAHPPDAGRVAAGPPCGPPALFW